MRTPSRVGVSCLLVLCASPALASKDLSILTGGLDVNGVWHPYPAIEYVRSPEHEQAGIQITATLAPLLAANPTKPLLIVVKGQSTGQAYGQRVHELLSRIESPADGFTDLRRPGVKVIKCAQGGKTADSWANPNDVAWSVCLQRVIEAGYSPDDVVVGLTYLTQGFPLEAGVMTAERVGAVIENFGAHFPQAKVQLLVPVNWTGQGSHEAGSRAPISSTWQDQQAMLANVGVAPNGIWVDYVCAYASGNVPTPCSASSKNPPITYTAADTSDDGVHWAAWNGLEEARHSADKPARATLGKMFDDPVFWFLWNGTQPPNVEPPPPPPPPVTVPITGDLTKAGASCTFTASFGTVTLPASWCAGL